MYVKKTEGGEVREWRASYDEDEQLETRTLCKEQDDQNERVHLQAKLQS